MTDPLFPIDENTPVGSDEGYDRLNNMLIQVFLVHAEKYLRKQLAGGTFFPRFCEGHPFKLTYTADFKPEDIAYAAKKVGLVLPKIQLIL